MKSLEQFIAESKDNVFAVVDENEVILNVFNTQEEADKEIESLKDNPVPVKVKRMKRSEVEETSKE